METPIYNILSLDKCFQLPRTHSFGSSSESLLQSPAFEVTVNKCSTGPLDIISNVTAKNGPLLGFVVIAS